MTPQEKALELVDNFRLNVEDYEGSGLNSFKAKQCALIAVDEVLNYDNQFIQTEEQFNYWKEVKQEIEKL